MCEGEECRMNRTDPYNNDSKKKKKGSSTNRLCANFWPLARDFWIFLWCVFFFANRDFLRKPENPILHSKGTLECFCTHM